jgi:hypothetical protein
VHGDLTPLLSVVAKALGLVKHEGKRVCVFALVRNPCQQTYALTVRHGVESEMLFDFVWTDGTTPKHASRTRGNIIWPQVGTYPEMDAAILDMPADWSQLPAIKTQSFKAPMLSAWLVGGNQSAGFLVGLDDKLKQSECTFTLKQTTAGLWYLEHTATTIVGDCGALLITTDHRIVGPQRTPMIIGIHQFGGIGLNANGAMAITPELCGHLN